MKEKNIVEGSDAASIDVIKNALSQPKDKVDQTKVK